MKGVDVVAIDKQYGGGVIGLEASIVEKVGDFELADAPQHTSNPYIQHRTVTVVFGNLPGLVDRLERFSSDGKGFQSPGFEGFFETGSIKSLVLVTHGSPGRVDINGLGAPVLEADDLAEKPVSNGLPDWGGPLSPKLFQRLGNFLAADATVRIDGCNIGTGVKGTELLMAMSSKWPGVRVIAFADYAVIDRVDSDRRVWGVHDSNDLYPKHPGKWEMQIEGAFNAARSEDSPNAKIARNGEIIKWPASEILKRSFLEDLILNLTDNPLKYPFGYGF